MEIGKRLSADLSAREIGSFATMAKNEGAPRRRGRPPVSTEKRKRHTLSFRLADDLKEALQARSENNGRSLSEEVESILTIELYIDINMRQKVEDGLEPALGSIYNDRIQTVNECIIFLNILSRLFRDLSNLSFFASNMLVAAWINTYNELYDIARSALRDVEHKALTESNEIIIDFAVDRLASVTDMDEEDKQKLRDEFINSKKEASEVLASILKDRGLK